MIEVPWHGRCVVAWIGGGPKNVSLMAQSGELVGQMQLLVTP